MIYGGFAGVYDDMMSEIPYEMWFEKLHEYLKKQGKSGGHLCELGCGTGEMTGRFAKVGYEVTGIDLSPDMLALAAGKKEDGQNILYLHQDMTDFSLHKPADVVLCICDSINYLLREEELREMFRCVREALAEDGLFLFDMKTEYCFQEVLGNELRVEDEEDYTVIWENEYDPETAVNEYVLTMFVQREDGVYERYDECHRQKAYSPEQIKALLEETGFVVRECFGADVMTPPGPEEERIYFVTSQKGEQEG